MKCAVLCLLSLLETQFHPSVLLPSAPTLFGGSQRVIHAADLELDGQPGEQGRLVFALPQHVVPDSRRIQRFLFDGIEAIWLIATKVVRFYDKNSRMLKGVGVWTVEQDKAA